MTMGSGVAFGSSVASICGTVVVIVKIIVSSKKPLAPIKEDKGATEVMLKVIQKLQETMEDRAETDKERSKTDYEILKNLIEMNQTAKSTHFKINEVLKVIPMIEQNTKDLTNDTDKIKETVAEIRITQKSIVQLIK